MLLLLLMEMKMILRLAAACLLLLGLLSVAAAQSSVITLPTPRASGNASTTVAVTNTFQSIFLANTARVGCTVQNTGTNSMYVYFGAIAGATTAKSVKLAAGQSVSCQSGGMVIRDQVSITGTATETFYAAQQ